MEVQVKDSEQQIDGSRQNEFSVDVGKELRRISFIFALI